MSGNLSEIPIGDAVIKIRWSDFKVGTSFFLPCLSCIKLQREIKRKAEELDINIAYKIVIEKNIRGLRVWRIS